MTTTYNQFDSSTGLTLENSQVASGSLSTTSPNVASRSTGTITPSPVAQSIDTSLAKLAAKPGGTLAWLQMSADGSNWTNTSGDDVSNVAGRSFDGVNDQISVANHADFQPGSGAFSVSLRVKLPASNQFGTLISCRNTASPFVQWSLIVAGALAGSTSGKQIRLTWLESGTKDWRRLTVANFADDQWHTIGFTASGSALTLYIDGVAVPVTTQNTGTYPAPAPTASLLVGGDTSLWTSGSIDEARVWKGVALSASEHLDIARRHHDAHTSSGERKLWWRLNETSGSTAADASGNGHDGTISGATVITDFASLPMYGERVVGDTSVAQVAVFDGVDDRLSRAYASVFHSSSTLSVSAWIRTTSNASSNVQIVASRYRGGTNQRAWLLGVIPSAGALRVVVSADGGATNIKAYTSSIAGLNDGQWHHIATTFNAGTLKLYIDGVEDTTPTKTNDAAITTIHNPGFGTDFLLGNFADLTSVNYFAGEIANVGLWNDVRTGGEIASSYANGPDDTGDGNLIGYWPVGYGGSLLTDLGPNGLALTSSGPTAIERWDRPMTVGGVEESLSLSSLGLTTTVAWRVLFRSESSERTAKLDEVGFVSTDTPPTGGPFPHFLRRSTTLSGGLAAC